ncbi:hypothetical protein FRC03_010378 [Tulasnella sp. 419]|nr:hypothetical protein FRC03_010378 [Tulasnella sp. 419]
MRSLSSILTGGEDDSSYGHLTMRSLIRCWEDGDLLWQLRAVQGFAQFSLGTPNNHNTRFMEQWVNDMEEFVKALSQSQENDPEAYKRHYQHLQVFLDAGVFDAFAGMPVTFKGKLPDLCYRALKVLRALMEAIRDPAEFEESLEKMLGLGGVGAIKLQMTLESTGPLLRSVAIACFREMYTRACLSEGISAEKFAKQLQAFLVCFEKSHYKVCYWVFDGMCSNPLVLFQQVLEQWNEPQSLLRREIEGLYGKIESTQVENHLRRWSQSNQQIALEAALAMFEYRVEPMSRKFALEVLQKEQYILPLLLVAASEERPSWNITRETDSLAALILVHLMRLPMNVIPGSEAPLGCSNSAEQEEWDAAMECNRKLWTTEVALEAVIKMRKKIINENIAVLEKYVQCRPVGGLWYRFITL